MTAMHCKPEFNGCSVADSAVLFQGLKGRYKRLSQVVILSVYEKKNGTDKYDVPVRRAFRWASDQQSCSAEASMIVRIPAPWLTKEIIFVCTVFLSVTLWMTCERTLIHAQSMLRSTPQNLQVALWNSQLW